MLKVINLKIKIDTRNSIFFVIYLAQVNSMVDKEKKMIFGIVCGLKPRMKEKSVWVNICLKMIGGKES